MLCVKLRPPVNHDDVNPFTCGRFQTDLSGMFRYSPSLLLFCPNCFKYKYLQILNRFSLFSLINKKKTSWRILRRLDFSAELPVVPVTIKLFYCQAELVVKMMMMMMNLCFSVCFTRNSSQGLRPSEATPGCSSGWRDGGWGGVRGTEGGGLTLELRGRTKWRLQLRPPQPSKRVS